MGDTGVCREQLRVEDAPGVGAREVAGFGDGVEGLAEGGGVDGEVVDGFVLAGGDVGMVGREGEHRLHGASVGGCEASALLSMRLC